MTERTKTVSEELSGARDELTDLVVSLEAQAGGPVDRARTVLGAVERALDLVQNLRCDIETALGRL